MNESVEYARYKVLLKSSSIGNRLARIGLFMHLLNFTLSIPKVRSVQVKEEDPADKQLYGSATLSVLCISMFKNALAELIFLLF